MRERKISLNSFDKKECCSCAKSYVKGFNFCCSKDDEIISPIAIRPCYEEDTELKKFLIKVSGEIGTD